MRTFTVISSLILLAVIALSCSRRIIRPTEVRLLGEWDFLYEYLADGTKTDSFTTSVGSTHPYAMLGFEYSSGFVLNEDESFLITWYSRESQAFDGHKWELKKDTLVLTPREDGPSYHYLVSNLSRNGLDFENLDRGVKWRLMRVEE